MNAAADAMTTAPEHQVGGQALRAWVDRLYREFSVPPAAQFSSPYVQGLADVPVDFLDRVLERIHRQRPHGPGDGPPPVAFFQQLWQRRQARLAGTVAPCDQIEGHRVRALRTELKRETAVALSGYGTPAFRYRPLPTWMREIITEVLQIWEADGYPARLAGHRPDEAHAIVESYVDAAVERFNAIARDRFNLTPPT